MARIRVLSLLLLLLLVAPGAAEEEDLTLTMPFKLRDRHTTRLALNDVRRYLDKGRLDHALEEAQRVLDDMPEDLHLVASTSPSTRWRLAAEEVRELLAGLDQDARRSYDRLASAAGAPLLSRAIRAHDLKLMGEVVERYGASRLGLEAARVLSGASLEAGAPRDAAWWAREGLRFHPQDPSLWGHRIDALGLSGEMERLRRLDLPDVPSDLAQRREEWLARAEARPADPTWPLWCGEPGRDRAALSEGPLPEAPRWTSPVPFPFRRLDQERPSGWMHDDSRSFWAWWESFRPFHPVAEGNTAYVGNGRALYAVDVFSGRRRWILDASTVPELPLVQAESMGEGRTSYERAFAPAIWGDLLIGTVEVDRPYHADRLQRVEISTYLPHRILVAADRETGRLRWWMGMQAFDALTLADRSIVSPCVVSEGLVMAMTSLYTGSFHEVGMVALDAKTGRVRWHRVLGVGQQEQNLFGAPVKELSASAPAARDGEVYATSGLGFVAALAVRSGRVKWVASHQIQDIYPVQYWYRAPLRFPRVAPSPAVVVDDVVLVAPTDGLHLAAYERASGLLRWRVPYPPVPRPGLTSHFLGTADDGRRKVALLSGSTLKAFDLRDGALVWEGHFQEAFGEVNATIGRGVVTGGKVLVPTDMGLVQFDLAREGSFLGRVPWPHDVFGGNILPLPQVLLVTGRDRLKGFYSWERIAADVASRQRTNPRDPHVLLEAGEIFRMGGAHERAVEAFAGARKLAEDAEDREAVLLAAQGLYRTWLAVAELHGAQRPELAREALKRALAEASGAQGRVHVRIRLDALLMEDPRARVENLQKLVEISSGVTAPVPGFRDPVPTRAVALLRLADAWLEQAEPGKAVATLQLLLAEEGDAQLDDVPARSRGRTLIDEIRRIWGDEVYAPYEQEARRLLEIARKEKDAGLLESILRRFPNAAVVPEALLHVAEQRLKDDQAEPARAGLIDLLSEHADSPWAAAGAAQLARAYDALGRDGGMRFALAWLASRHGDARFEIDGKPETGRGFAARVGAALRPEPSPPPQPLTPPLEEVRFEQATEGAWGAQVSLSAPPGVTPPLALYRDGERLLGFDLVNAAVAFDLYPGTCNRAAWDDHIVVLALRHRLAAHNSEDGEAVWELPVRGTVTELGTAHGQVFALVHDTTRRSSGGDRTLLAIDLPTGDVLWRHTLDRSEYRDLAVSRTDVLLRQTRYHASHVWPAILVFDGLTGRLRHAVNMPPGKVQEGPLLVGDRLVYIARDGPGRFRLTAADVEGEKAPWTRILPGRAPSTALLSEGDRVVVLQQDGFLSSVRASDGQPVEATRIMVGVSTSRAEPYPFTKARLSEEELFLMPRTNRPPHYLGAWSTRTGKMLWERPWEERDGPSRAQIEVTPSHVVALTAWTRRRAAARVLLRVLDRRNGEIRQEIEPLGLGAEQGFLTMVEGWGTVVVFGNGGAAMYAKAK